LAAAPAAATVQPGVAPSVAVLPDNAVDVAYTGTDEAVYLFNVTSPSGPISLGGRFVHSPALVDAPANVLRPADALAVFARGTDGAVWWRHQTISGWTRWSSLGGRIVASPAAAATMNGQFGQLVVVASGPGGNLWMRNYVAGAWTPWHRVPGRFEDPTALGPVLAGTGPAAAYAPNGDALVAAVDRFGQTDLEGNMGAFGYTLILAGGKTASSPAVTAADGQAVLFVRGTDNRLWDRSRPVPLGDTDHFGPWTSLGGVLTSAVSASHAAVTTAVVALGTDNRIWMRAGEWPTLAPWRRVG
jgi:hypothetical protein